MVWNEYTTPRSAAASRATLREENSPADALTPSGVTTTWKRPSLPAGGRPADAAAAADTRVSAAVQHAALS
jgi:hypothetical protein